MTSFLKPFLLSSAVFYVAFLDVVSAQNVACPQNKNILKNYALNEDDTTRYRNHFLFERAYRLIEDMLTGKRPKSFKDAVFAVENAYLDGELSKKEYDAEINRVAHGVMLSASNDKVSPTRDMALNLAIYGYFYEPCPLNRYQPLKYDIRAITEGAYGGAAYGLVTHLLKTGKGSCRSLPYLYRILASETGAKAWIALAPMHSFIKQQDHNGKWWNLETTVGSFRSSGSIMEEMHVTEAGIRSGVYMSCLDETEELVLCLKDMLCFYEAKTGFYSNAFVRKTCELGLRYSSPNLIEVHKACDMQYQLNKQLWQAGLLKINDIKAHPVFGPQYKAVQEEFRKVDEMGYYEFTSEEYRHQYEKCVNRSKNKQ